MPEDNDFIAKIQFLDEVNDDSRSAINVLLAMRAVEIGHCISCLPCAGTSSSLGWYLREWTVSEYQSDPEKMLSQTVFTISLSD